MLKLDGNIEEQALLLKVNEQSKKAKKRAGKVLKLNRKERKLQEIIENGMNNPRYMEEAEMHKMQREVWKANSELWMQNYGR